LMRQAGAEAGGRLHLGRSRNDINATLDRLTARRIALDLAGRCIALRRALLERARAHADTVMPGYTHLQPAQPITFGFYLAGVAEALARDTQRLLDACGAIDLCPLGACALAGTSVPIERERLAALLGFEAVMLHAQDAVTSRDYAHDLAAAMLSLASTWGRLAQDLYVWGTQEFALISFPDRIAGTSSIMPQKRNPIAIEYLKASAGEVLGGVVASFAIVKGGHFSHAGDTGRSALAPLWPALRLAGNALSVARVVIDAVEPDGDTMAARAAAGFSTATDIADCLVRDSGLSFRQAHHVVAELVRAALAAGTAPEALSPGDVSRAAEAVLARPVTLSPDQLVRAVDPVQSIAARVSIGAASPEETRRMIGLALVVLDRDAAELRDRSSAITTSQAGLWQVVATLARPAAAVAS